MQILAKICKVNSDLKLEISPSQNLHSQFGSKAWNLSNMKWISCFMKGCLTPFFMKDMPVSHSDLSFKRLLPAYWIMYLTPQITPLQWRRATKGVLYSATIQTQKALVTLQFHIKRLTFSCLWQTIQHPRVNPGWWDVSLIPKLLWRTNCPILGIFCWTLIFHSLMLFWHIDSLGYFWFGEEIRPFNLTTN